MSYTKIPLFFTFLGMVYFWAKDILFWVQKSVIQSNVALLALQKIIINSLKNIINLF